MIYIFGNISSLDCWISSELTVSNFSSSLFLALAQYEGKDRGHILNNKYWHISFFFVLLPHTENISKSKIEAKQMARPLRVEYPGAYYHVINRGNNQEKILKK